MLKTEWAWWGRWIRTLSGLACLQVVIQALNAVTGFLLVRWLPKEEYALFTIANSIQTMLMLIADMGLTVALISIGGRVWQEPVRHASLIADGLRMRMKLLAVSALVVLPAGGWLLLKTGATWGYALVLMALIFASGLFAASGLVQATVPRLHGRYKSVQLAELWAAASRMLASVAGALVSATALVGTGAAALAQAVFCGRIKRESSSLIGAPAGTSDADRGEIRSTIKTLAPTALFYGFQGQVTTFLIATFGGGRQVAELGALMRFGIVFSVIGVILAQVVSPAAARATDPGHYRQMLRRALLGYGVFALAVVLGARVLAVPALALLGPGYGNLQAELVLGMISYAIAGLSTLLWAFVAARGWIQHVWGIIPLTLLTQTILVQLLSLDTVGGVLIFGGLSALPGVFWFFILGYLGYKHLSKLSVHAH